MCIHGMAFLNICDNKFSLEIGKCIPKVSINDLGFYLKNSNPERSFTVRFVEISGKYSGN